MSYKLFLIASIGAPRSHHALFLETDPSSKSGMVLNVVGNIQAGMAFEERRADDPETADTFVAKTYLGDVEAGDVDRVCGICRGNAAPGKQFDGARRLFPGEKLRRCQEWTAETVGLLEREGVLVRPEDTRTEGLVKGGGIVAALG